MYNVEKLFRLLKKDFLLFSKARDILDYLLLVQRDYQVGLCIINDNLNHITHNDIQKITKFSPEYLCLVLNSDGESYSLLSKVIKRLLNNQSINEQFRLSNNIDNQSVKSISRKRDISVFCIEHDILSLGFQHLLPTNLYNKKREVFKIDHDFINYLKSQYPSVNIESELSNIFKYFIDNPDARKPSYYIRTYIERWVSKTLNYQKQRGSLSYISSASKFYEDLKKNGI
jgi:hypothetical protein